MKIKREFEWATIVYEQSSYDVCVIVRNDEIVALDEIRPIDSEIDITPVMDIRVMDWMFDMASDEINLTLAESPCRSMSSKTRLIEGV